jgi:tetratricopeptide (TPR) repeat protein/CHAT domain-containing protein
MVLSVLVLALQLATPQAPVDVDPALAALLTRFYETQEKEDLPGYLALWSPNAQSGQRAAQLKYIFESGDDVFSDLTITRASVTADAARLRIRVRRTRTSVRPSGGPPMVANHTATVALAFEKIAGEWKLLSEGPAADDVAAALLEATTDAARDAVLAAETEVGGLEVLSSLGRRAGAAAISQDFRRAQTVHETQLFAARRGGFKKEEGEALQNIANALYFQRKYPEALTAYEQRLAVEREREDDAGMASALAGIGTIRYSFGEYTESLARYQEALALHEKADDVAGIAFVSLSIGNIGYLQGDFPAAIGAYRRALDLHRTMHNADGESRALEGLGRVYSTQGDYASALTAFDAVRTDRRLSTARGRLAPVAQSIGEVHFRLGNLDAARASFEESRGHFEAVKDLPNVGRVLQGLGLTELVAARFPLAEGLYRRSEEICSKEDAECAAHAVAGLAFAQLAQDKFWDSATSYRKAIAAFKALNRQEETARAEIGLSEALVAAGDSAGGIEAAAEARRAAVVMENDDVLWRALTAEARAVRKLGDRPRALGISRAALAALDRLEAAALDRPAASLPADASRAFTTFAILQAESGDAAGAFRTAERLHAVALRAALATNEREIARGMTPEERAEERRLSTAVATFVARIARERGLPKPDQARMASLRQSLAEATVLRRDWMARLFERLPDLAGWRGLAPPTAPDLKSHSQPDTLLLSFVLDDEDLLVLASTVAPVPESAEDKAVPGSLPVEAHVVPLARRQIAQLTATLQQPSVLADSAAWRKAASELTALFPPAVRSRLAAAARVTIVPHEVLWRVPFHALPSGDGYLADHAVVVLAGSASMAARAGEPPASAGGSLVVVGAPQLTASRIDRMKQVAPAWALRAVEDAAQEVAAAAAAHTDAKESLVGGAATERAVREALSRADRVHVAAPFRINAASPLFSAVLLTAPEPPAPPAPGASEPAPAPPAPSLDAGDDGALELREVMNLTSPSRVVVLSDGAATSMRDSAAAAQVLEWGWLAAGVPSLMISRWAAPPAARDRLMAELYTRLQAGDPPATAVAAAQRVVRANAATAPPINWAGWMVVGADR